MMNNLGDIFRGVQFLKKRLSGLSCFEVPKNLTKAQKELIEKFEEAITDHQPEQNKFKEAFKKFSSKKNK